MFRTATMFLCAHPDLSLPPSFLCLFSVFFHPCQSSDTVFSSVSVAPPSETVPHPNLFTLWPLLWAVDLDQKATTLSRAFSHTGGGIVQLLHLASPFTLILSLGPQAPRLCWGL